MPQRTANMALRVHRDGKRIKIAAGETFNFSKEELADITAIDKNAVRKPIDETIDEVEVGTKAPTKPETDDENDVVVDTKPKLLTAAEKKKQAAAEAKKKADDEAGDNSGDDDL